MLRSFLRVALLCVLLRTCFSLHLLGEGVSGMTLDECMSVLLSETGLIDAINTCWQGKQTLQEVCHASTSAEVTQRCCLPRVQTYTLCQFYSVQKYDAMLKYLLQELALGRCIQVAEAEPCNHELGLMTVATVLRQDQLLRQAANMTFEELVRGMFHIDANMQTFTQVVLSSPDETTFRSVTDYWNFHATWGSVLAQRYFQEGLAEEYFRSFAMQPTFGYLSTGVFAKGHCAGSPASVGLNEDFYLTLLAAGEPSAANHERELIQQLSIETDLRYSNPFCHYILVLTLWHAYVPDFAGKAYDVLEIGAGAALLLQIFVRHNFSFSTWTIVDLPHVSELQTYTARELGLHNRYWSERPNYFTSVLTNSFSGAADMEVKCGEFGSQEVDTVDVSGRDAWFYWRLSCPPRETLVVACFSLSEVSWNDFTWYMQHLKAVNVAWLLYCDSTTWPSPQLLQRKRDELSKSFQEIRTFEYALHSDGYVKNRITVFSSRKWMDERHAEPS